MRLFRNLRLQSTVILAEKIAIFWRGVTLRRYKSFLRLERFYTLCLANNLFCSQKIIQYQKEEDLTLP